MNYNDWLKDSGFLSASNAKASFKRCYEDHPALKIGDYQIYGGNCGHPAVTDADLYVGLDGIHSGGPAGRPVLSYYFPITDMSVPKDVDAFKALITYIAQALQDGKKVHVGCIGGHGRTGLVFAALVQVMTGEKDAISYVRKHYCTKAVESAKQVDWLNEHFGITKVAGAKEYGTGKGKAKASQDWGSSQAALPFVPDINMTKDVHVQHVKSKGSIW